MLKINNLKTFLYIFILCGYFVLATQNIFSKSINLVLSIDLNSLDPNYANRFWQMNPIENMWSGLFETDANGDIKNAIVDSWSVNENKTVYIFKLKKTMWSDGEPLTAYDFVFSYERVLNPNTATNHSAILYDIKGAKDYNLGKIKNFNKVGVKALDNYTLQIILENPSSIYIKKLLHSVFYPIPSHIVKKYGKDWTKIENIVSNGAYVVKLWKPQSVITLVKNNNYYDKNIVNIDNINFIYVGFDVNLEYKMFLANQIDIANFSSKMLNEVSTKFKNNFYVYPVKVQSYLSINIKNPSNKMLLNNNVRTAIAYALDSFYITEKLKINSLPSNTIVPNLFKNYQSKLPVWSNLSFNKRLENAIKIMKNLGYNENNMLVVKYYYFNSKNSNDLAILMKDILKKIYIDVQFYAFDVATFYSEVESNKHDIAFVTWLADYDDPSTFFYIALSGIPNNYSGYNNKYFDELLKTAIIKEDENERNLLYNKAEEILYKDIVYLPYTTSTRNIVISNKILNFKPNSMGNNLVKWLDVQ